MSDKECTVEVHETQSSVDFARTELGPGIWSFTTALPAEDRVPTPAEVLAYRESRSEPVRRAE